MGPASLSALLALPLAAIEFAAFGGTNFAKTELLRDTSASKKMFEPLSNIGVDAYQMLDIVNKICDSGKKPECKQIIISGGITSFLDGYYLIQKSKLPSLFGQASSFLTYARDDYSKLQEFVSKQIKGLEMANAYLRVKEIP
jgi:isopentenyl-diphosphate delta-isomerase